MIDRERLVKTFREIVAVDAPSRQERRMADFLLERFRKLQVPGLTAEEDQAGEKIPGNAGNLFIKVPGEGEPVMLTGHMDTVEPSRGKKAVLHEDGRITSDGTTVLGADDGACLASILEVLTVLQEKNLRHKPLEILISASEEPYCEGAKVFDFSKVKAKQAFTFDLAGEVGRAAYAAPSIYTFEAVFHGVSSHAGFAPEKGISAVKAAAEAISAIPCGKLGDSTVNIGRVQGGLQDNIVPDLCRFTGEIRSFDDGECDRLAAETEKKVRDAAAAGKCTVEYAGVKHIRAYRTPEGADAVKMLERAVARTGSTLTLERTHGGSDGNVISGYGIETLVVATAMNACHTCQEYTTVSQLEKAAEIMLGLTLA